MKQQTLSAINRLINFNQMFLNEALEKDSLDKEKISFLRRDMKKLFEKERQIRADKISDLELLEILLGYLEEIEICQTIARKLRLNEKEKLK